MAPAKEDWSILLRAVHQLLSSARLYLYLQIFTYEEPHGCAETGGHESVERPDWVDVDGVGALRLWVSWGTHGVFSSPEDSQIWDISAEGYYADVLAVWVVQWLVGWSAISDGVEVRFNRGTPVVMTN